MNQSVFCSISHGVLRLARGAVCLLPLFFAGCFDPESAAEKSTKAPSLGISAIGRFFSFGRTATNKSPEAVSTPETLPFAPGSISGLIDPADSSPEPGVAMPDFLGAYRGSPGSSFKTGGEPGLLPGKARRESTSRFAAVASVILDSPFSQLFSSVFQVNQTDEVFLNPFTEAKKKQEPSPAAATSDTKTPAADKTTSDSPASPEAAKTESADSAAAAPGSGTTVSEWFMIVGDLDGSGILSVVPARRSGDTSFVSSDGERSFNLFINSAAAEQQRAFYVDDINGDGNPDLLVTSRAALSGGVLLGDGEGNYRFADKFLTGFEPTIPSAGPLREGSRDILTVNARTGVLKTFHMAARYEVTQKQQLEFVPDYLLHLVAEEGSAEFLMVAQVEGKRRIARWMDDHSLEATSETLPVEPLVFSRDLGSDSVKAYQVGNYASLILNSQGHSYNVANLHLFPGVFLIIGDLYRDGATDVAVGNLRLFTPAQGTR